MTVDELLDCIGEVDEKYICKAEQYKPANRAMLYMAAAWAVVIVGAAGIIIGRTADSGIVTETELTVISDSSESVQTTFDTPAPTESEQTAQTKPTEKTEQTVQTVPTEQTTSSIETIVTTADDEAIATTAGTTVTVSETTPPETVGTTVSETKPTASETTVTETSAIDEGEYTYEVDEALAEIKFDSFDRLKGYIENRDESKEGLLEEEIKQYFSNAEGLYLLEDMCPDDYVHDTVTKDDITAVYISPTYVQTCFKMYGKDMWLFCYHSDISGERELEYAKYAIENDPDNAFEADSYDGNTVYCYSTQFTRFPPYDQGRGLNYVWQQDGKYFMLVTSGNYLADHTGLCNARLCSFSE